jgi:2'-5' RNA ligase
MSNTSTSDTRFFNWKDYGFFEYMLVINPVNDVKEKLIREKHDFYEQYNEEGALQTLPHISLLCFLANEAMEDILIRWIQRICNKHNRFTVTFNNFGGFPPHTVYLRIQDPLPLHQLMKELKVIDSFVSSSGCPPLQVNLKPHMAIAKTLSPAIFHNALTAYSSKTFHESFVAEELVLLKRSHQFDGCKKVNVFQLPSLEG